MRNQILFEELQDYQRLQKDHDDIYHHDILVLGVSRKMNHVVLHLIKYLEPLSSLPISEPKNKKAFIDAFIMVVSASNLLSICLSKVLEDDKNYNNTTFISTYIRILSQLAKASDAADHQEDYPIRSVWNESIQELFSLLISEANLRKLPLLKEAKHRLAEVEKEHPLNDILQARNK